MPERNLIVKKLVKHNNMKEIKIYSLNDFHGMIFSDNSGSGISKIGDFLVNQKKENDCVIVLSAGDMFQGGSVSTLTKGEALVEAMNIIGFDAMTIGNHEFDWGIETILKYNDYNQDNGELNCKFIISNIIDKSLNEKPEWALPYTTFIKNGLKIGVLGIIGEEQEKDMYVTTRPWQYILGALAGDIETEYNVIANIDDTGYDFYIANQLTEYYRNNLDKECILGEEFASH